MEESVPRVLAAGGGRWIISLPLLGVFASNAPLGVLDYLGVLLWLVGFVFEAGSDWQLARFSATRPMPTPSWTGLWRFTRHPNYFGEACVWWGFWFIACCAGTWWSVAGPALLTFLLLMRGVRRQERDMAIVGRNMPTTS